MLLSAVALLSFTIMADAQSGNADPHERLWQSFLTPPDSISDIMD